MILFSIHLTFRLSKVKESGLYQKWKKYYEIEVKEKHSNATENDYEFAFVFVHFINYLNLIYIGHSLALLILLSEMRCIVNHV